MVCLIGRVAGAKVPDRIGPGRAVSTALVFVGASLLLLAAVPEPWALWVAAAGFGVGMAFNYPSLMAIVVNRVDERERVAALSSFTMFFELGSVVGGLALGGVGEIFGKRTGFAGGIVCCVDRPRRVVDEGRRATRSTSRWTSPSTHRSSAIERGRARRR